MSVPQFCPITLDDGWFIGEDKRLRFTVRNAAGEAENIAGWTFSWMFKRRRSDPDTSAILHKTTADDITIIDPDNGVCEVFVSDEDSEDDQIYPERDYWHELKRMDDGEESIEAHGPAALNHPLHKA